MQCLFLIPHPSERQILLASSPSGYSFPSWTLPETWAGRPTQEHERALLLNQAVHEQFGLTTVVLLVTSRNTERLAIFETLRLPSVPLLAGHWVSAEGLVSLPFVDPSHRPLLEAWLAEEEQIVQGERMPWQRRGWFTETVSWMAHQLELQGQSLHTPVEQLYTKYGACMLRGNTTDGKVYLKALPPSFAREPQLVAYLARHFPRLVPPILAINETHNWLLMQQAPGRLLSDLIDVSAWERALCTFAELQIACVSRKEELLAIGCPDLRLSVISAQLKPLLDDQAALRVDQSDGLSREQVIQLRTRVPELQATCHCLAECGVPETLEHGDFNPMNILVQDGQMTYLDWTDASLTHPFFSALRLLSYFLPTSLKEQHPHLIQRLRTAYLEPWTAYAPMDRLLQAFEHATTPMLLHRALNYSLLDFTRRGIPWERSMVVTRHLQAL